MGRTVAAYQPQYLPRLHYLARAAQADVFIFYDNAQLARRSPQNRAQIERGEPMYITIPVSRESEETLIKDVNIELDTPWPLEHLSLIKQRYDTTAHDLEPYFNSIIPPVLDLSKEDFSMFDERTSQRVIKAKELDQQWRSQKSKLDSLKHERNALDDRISSATGNEKQKFITEAKKIKQKINELESNVRTLKQHRDTILISAGQTVIKRYPKENVHDYLMDESTVWDRIDTNIINSNDPSLTEFTIPLIHNLFDRFGIETELAVASELPVRRGNDPSGYLARLTEYLGGTNYLSGKVGYDEYLDETVFQKRGLNVSVQNWTPSWERGNVCCLDVLYSSTEPGQYIR